MKTAPTDDDGKNGWGKLTSTIYNDLDCEEICSSTGCGMWRIKGQIYYSANMEILSCLPVTGENCTLNKGDCRERTTIEKNESEVHERKHFNLWREFINEWNDRIENDKTTFKTCEDIKNYIDILLIAFEYEKEQMISRQNSHCPDFSLEPVYRMDDPCGHQLFSHFRKCR